jgi:hypothetical protein
MRERGHPFDGFLQAFIGPRETRDPPPQPRATLLKDVLGTMEEIDLGMSNCFGEIDEGMDEALRARPAEVYGRHAGWNFNGLVWFEGGLFHEQGRCYRVPRKEISAPTLGKLMSAVNAEFGSE